MLNELRSGVKVVGMKQLKRAIRDHLVQEVFLALDADPMMTDPIRALCGTEIPITEVSSMRELGLACGISVGASSAGLLKQAE